MYKHLNFENSVRQLILEQTRQDASIVWGEFAFPTWGMHIALPARTINIMAEIVYCLNRFSQLCTIVPDPY
jgi:hypothetical protein